MKAIQLVKHGDDVSCFQIKEIETPTPQGGEVRIKIQAFGLNYADVMARKGLYKDAPSLPSVLGYDVVGIIDAVGKDVDNNKIGKRVVAITEFGGYAEYAITKEVATLEISSDMAASTAAALATQYATAYYATFQLGNIQEGDRVFIHAAAGGVGLALIQLCKLKNCTIYGTVSNEKKADVIRAVGVHHIINTSKQNIYDELQKLENNLDVIFDSVGGKGVKLGFKALHAGGRIICYGGSQLTEGSGIFNLIKFGLSFGFYSPVQLLSQSKSILGINMLKIMRENPHQLQPILSGVVKLLWENKIAMPIGVSFPVSELFKAHMHLESRQSIGKIAVEW